VGSAPHSQAPDYSDELWDDSGGAGNSRSPLSLVTASCPSSVCAARRRRVVSKLGSLAAFVLRGTTLPASRVNALHTTVENLGGTRSNDVHSPVGRYSRYSVSVRPTFQLPTFCAALNPSSRSASLDIPRHMTMLPGGGSLARAR